MVIKSDIIHYLVPSSNAANDLDHKAEAYTMSKELLIYINLQTDNNFEHQSTKLWLYPIQYSFYCSVGLQRPARRRYSITMKALLEKERKVPGTIQSLVSSLLFHQILEAIVFSILNHCWKSSRHLTQVHAHRPCFVSFYLAL